MWFKNLVLYRLPVGWAITRAALVEQLARGPFTPCPSNQPSSRGWVAPRADGDLVYSLDNDNLLLRLRTETRLLPSSVVIKEVEARANLLEDQQGYAPGRKQLKELRERITEELLPRAFTRAQDTYVWVNKSAGWFGVNAASNGKAEAVIEHLRHCLDEFPLSMLHTNLSPQAAMADWLGGGEAPTGFTIDRDCELKARGDEKAAVAFKRHDLQDETNSEIKSHLAAGKLPTRLALTWDERISFVLTEKMEIKRLAFLDLLKEQAEKSAEHADEQFDADFTLMVGEFARFIPQVIQALNGEVDTDDGSDLS